jgi:hypothetical protein
MINRQSLFAILFIFISGLVTTLNVSAQTPREAGNVVEATDGACELNSRFIDLLIADAKSTGDRIFVISRVGANENHKLDAVRLAAMRRYFLNGPRFDLKRAVFAAGDALEGNKQGRVELYLGSKLYLVSKAQKNKSVCITCCDASPPDSTVKRKV